MAPVRHPSITIWATTQSEADEQLNSAVMAMQEQAFCCVARRGLLATKHGGGEFTVELSDLVPYGQTWEEVR